MRIIGCRLKGDVLVAVLAEFRSVDRAKAGEKFFELLYAVLGGPFGDYAASHDDQGGGDKGPARGAELRAAAADEPLNPKTSRRDQQGQQDEVQPVEENVINNFGHGGCRDASVPGNAKRLGHKWRSDATPTYRLF